MSHLPVIVGMGGINSAGRSSFHHAYRRLVIESLPQADADQTLSNLAVLMGLAQFNGTNWIDANENPIDINQFLSVNRESILNSTLIRKLETNLLDTNHFYHHKKATINAHDENENLSFILQTRNLPTSIPDNWQVTSIDSGLNSKVVINGDLELMFKDSHVSPVSCAGQLPSGFTPGSLYPSRHHPRGLELTVYGASDAISSLGIDWETIQRTVRPDQISVYAGSSLSQLDYNGNGGMMQARLLGKKITSKQLPLGFGEMPADFMNAYLLGNIGTTGTNLGACATFHYNLKQGIRDIQNGTHRVVIVGGSEAPILPEIIEAFDNMGALADDAKLRRLDELDENTNPDFRRPCRPFGSNVGFTLGESAQFIVLFDDALALEMGANIYGAVNDVFISADGFKKSIASPGVGNYITMAKAAAATQAVIGEESLKHKTFVQAHGTSTPQNRVTESLILTDIAKQFGIENWPVTAIKSYLGHSLCCAGADQLVSSLGVWKYGIIPGILTTDQIADDVSKDRINYLLDHQDVGPDAMDAVLLNAKGFGGNNATASILSPAITQSMLAHKHGKQAMTAYQNSNETVAETANTYDEKCCREQINPIYKFDFNVKTGDDVSFSGKEIKIAGYTSGIDIDLANPYSDMCE